MTSKNNFIAFLLVLTLVSCKKENTFTDYKYADKPVVLNCENFDSKLYHEALYAFEQDILDFYSKRNPKNSLIQAYNLFIREAVSGRATYENIISKHTVQVFEALKSESNLWSMDTNANHLNYNNSFVNCISNNMHDKDLKATFNALVSTNSMNSKLFGAPLMSNYRSVLQDKYLAAYIAFDLYYAKLFDIDFTKINLDTPETKVDFNSITEQPVADPHAGHNH